MSVGPSHGDLGINCGGFSFRYKHAQHLCVSERVPTGANIQQARIDTGHDDSLAACRSRRIKDMLQHLGQGTLPEWHMCLLPRRARCNQRRIRIRFAANAVLEDGQTHVDLARLTHALRPMFGPVAGGLGAGKIDEVQEPILSRRYLRILDANAADGVRARRGVILDSLLRAAEGGSGFNVAEDLVRADDVMLQSAGELDDAKAVFKDRDGLAGIQEVYVANEIELALRTGVGSLQDLGCQLTMCGISC